MHEPIYTWSTGRFSFVKSDSFFTWSGLNPTVATGSIAEASIVNGFLIDCVRIRPPLFKRGERLSLVVAVLALDKRPEVVDRHRVGHAEAAGAARLDRHVGKRHPLLHGHGVDDRSGEFDHAVGGAVHRQPPDDFEYHVLGITPFGEFAVDHNTDGCRLTESTNALEDADFEISGADSCGKRAERAVRAGVAVAHDHGITRP